MIGDLRNQDVCRAALDQCFDEVLPTRHGGREKAPAAVCRKLAMAKSGDTTEIWGDGKQTRSFLYIGECAEGATLLLRSGFTGPGSDEMVTVSQPVEFVADLPGKRIEKQNIDGPQRVRGRNSDNRLIREKLHWAPSHGLHEGLVVTYEWIEHQVRQNAH
jgi:GDP-D-mannose 3', 5'-epimerase